MSDLVISEPLASRIRELAQHAHLSPETILARWVEWYLPAPRPIPDAAIDVPPDVRDPAAYRDAIRQARPKLYRLARAYWQAQGDITCTALSDDELDAQFWFIDSEGVPHLKHEMGKIDPPPDPIEELFGLLDDFEE